MYSRCKNVGIVSIDDSTVYSILYIVKNIFFCITFAFSSWENIFLYIFEMEKKPYFFYILYL